MKPPKTDCYDYIRRTYDVPAYIGVGVELADKSTGVLVPAVSEQHYLHVRRDDGHTVLAHPTDNVTYHVAGVDETRVGK